jgi:hypothetical protein
LRIHRVLDGQERLFAIPPYNRREIALRIQSARLDPAVGIAKMY